VVPDAATSTTYSVRATDAAGNVSTIVTQVVPPALKTSATIAPAAADGANGWYRTTPTITVTKVGSTPNAEYSWDGGTTWTAYAAPVPVPDGAKTFRYRGVSGTERGDVNELAVKVDTVKPTVSASFDKTTRKLTATGSDATSGIDKIERSSNGGTSWTTFSSPETLPDTTAATYQFRAVDKAGHVSSTESITVKERLSNATVTVTATSPKTFGKAAAARVTVTADAGSPTPTGKVTILVDGRPIGAVSLSGGAASALLPADLRVGRHAVTAAYSGDADTKPATSAAATVTVQKALPTVSAKLSSSRIKAGSRPKVKATIAVPGTSVRPTGRVTVRLNGKVVKRDTLRAGDRGKVSITLPKVRRTGTHRVTVTYEGSADIRSRTSQPKTLRVR
jgi:hypothetical protein